MPAIAAARAGQGPPAPKSGARRARDGGGPWNELVRDRIRELRTVDPDAGVPDPDRRRYARSIAFREVSSVDALMSTAEQSAEACDPTLTFLACGCRVRVTRCGCNRSACVECAAVVGERRGRRVGAKLRATLAAVRGRAPGVRDPRMWSVHRIVFTVPPEYRARLASPAALAELRRELAAALIGTAAGKGRRRGGLGWTGCVIIPHPVGDKDPRRFHPHLNVFAWRSTWGRGKLDEAALAELKESWRELLGMGDEAGPVNVNVRFLRQDEDKRIEFSCRYMARIFAGWGGWAPKWVQWYGAAERTPELDDRCESCGEKLRPIATGADAEARWREVRAHRPTGPPCELVPERPGDVVDLPFAELAPAWWAANRARLLTPDPRISDRVELSRVEVVEAPQRELRLVVELSASSASRTPVGSVEAIAEVNRDTST